MKIERCDWETDEDYEIRYQCIRETQKQLQNWEQELSDLSNIELCTKLDKVIYNYGVGGYHEYVVKEAIRRLTIQNFSN